MPRVGEPAKSSRGVGLADNSKKRSALRRAGLSAAPVALCAAPRHFGLCAAPRSAPPALAPPALAPRYPRSRRSCPRHPYRPCPPALAPPLPPAPLVPAACARAACGQAASVMSARARAMLSGPPASLASVISRVTTSSGDRAASARVSLMTATGTTVVSPSEVSR